jgi:hypothetical protein
MADGVWCYCRGCQLHGDLLGLALRLWGCEIESALDRMRAAGMQVTPGQCREKRVRGYRHAVQQRLRFDAVWEAASLEAFGRHLSIDSLFQRFHLYEGPTEDQWERKMGGYIRAMSSRDLLDALRHKSKKENRRARNIRYGLFPGEGWGHLMVVPFHDLPKRLLGFLCIGKAGRASDYRFLHTQSLWRVETEHQRVADSGLCMYDVLSQETHDQRRYNGTIVVMEDPMFAIRLQARHLRQSNNPLPLVSTYPGRIQYKDVTHAWRLSVQHTWRLNPGHGWVFWGRQLTPSLLEMAARTDSSIAITEPPSGRDYSDVGQWLWRATQHRRHWSQLLEDTIMCRPKDELISFIQHTELGADLLQEFMKNCRRQTRKRLEEFLHAADKLGVVTVNHRLIQEDSSGWFLANTGTHICNGRLLIEQIKYVDGRTVASGRILADGGSLEFTEDMLRLQHRTFRWMHQKLMEAGKGNLVYRKGWSGWAAEIAMKLHPPVVVGQDTGDTTSSAPSQSGSSGDSTSI